MCLFQGLECEDFIIYVLQMTVNKMYEFRIIGHYKKAFLQIVFKKSQNLKILNILIQTIKDKKGQYNI